MELRYGAAEFFRRCPKASLASDTTNASMALENYFLIAPALDACNNIIDWKVFQSYGFEEAPPS